MRKKSKLTLALAVCSVSAAFAGLALSNTTVQATGESPAATFAMVQGAAVRAVENEAGIRWTTNVTESWVTDTNNIPTGATNVQFGTFVTAAKNVGSDVQVLTAENYQAENNPYEIVDLLCDEQPSYTNGTFTYYSAITYDFNTEQRDWTTADKNKAYATELIARSYVKYSTDGGNTYTYAYATAEKTKRCMRVVALAARDKGDHENIVKNYLGKEYEVDFGGYYETAVGSEDAAFTTVDNKQSVYTAAYYQSMQLNSTTTDGKISLQKLTDGRNYAVTLFDDNGNYAKTTFQYITRLLYQDKDNNIDTFKEVIYQDGAKVDINGYYVLGSNIDLSGTYYGKANTFAGTLDGNGKTISGISTVAASAYNQGGLFYTLKGTVKNVSVKGKQGKTSGLIAYTCTGPSSIENVYVETTLTSGGDGPIARLCADLTMKNVVIKVDKSGTITPGAVFSYTGKQAYPKVENCYYISVDGLTPLRAGWTSNTTHYHVATGGVDVVFGSTEQNQSKTVTKYTKDNKVTLTAYTGANAQTEFTAAVQNGMVKLSAELNALMGYTTAD